MSDDALAFARWAHAVGRPSARAGHLSYPHAIDTTEAAVSLDLDAIKGIVLKCSAGHRAEAGERIIDDLIAEVRTLRAAVGFQSAMADEAAEYLTEVVIERNAARADADRLAALGRHAPGCHFVIWYMDECSCEWADALAAHDAQVAER